MPTVSEKQEHFMQAVAHNPEFAHKVGVPQSVGKEFTDSSEAPSLLALPTEKQDDAGSIEPTNVAPVNKFAGANGRASGILFLTQDNQVLLMRRGNGGDFPFTFGLPGGHQNANETIEECARREAEEETGLKYEGKLEEIYDDGQFVTYLARIEKQFDVTMCDESTGYVWCNPVEAPQPLHPGLAVAFKIASANTEFDKAQLISEDLLTSPQMFANVGLFAIRITGTGLAYRSSIGEHVWRDPSIYLNQEFLNRCNGLIVIMDHPETDVLTSKEFKDRAVGSIILPYIKGDEVWGIAKIYDQDAINEICEGDISTSPSVVFDATAGNTTLTTENGEPLLIEGVPFLLDHIAIVTKKRGSKGVWDKGGEPAGVLLTNKEVSTMTENKVEPKADASGDMLKEILTAVKGISARVDEMEKNLPAPPLVTAADKKAKKDDDDDARMDDDDEEEEEEVKKDAKRKHRKDDDDDKARKDAKHHRKDNDDDDDDDRKDAEGSNPKEHEEGEIKPDDDEEMARKADEEEAMYADCQAKADSVFAAFGKSASRPLKGESVMAYRKRMLRGLQAYSDAYKEVNINLIKDEKLLSIAEKTIFADALVASRSDSTIAAGQLIELHTRDRAGRVITTFKGAVSSWLDQFKVPAQRATKFNINNNQR